MCVAALATPHLRAPSSDCAPSRKAWRESSVPKNIHIAHLIIDAGVDTAFVRDRIKQRGGAEALENLEPDQLMNPASVAQAYWQLYLQPRDAWTFELDVRPYREVW